MEKAENLVLHLNSLAKEISGTNAVEGITVLNRETNLEENYAVSGAFVYLQGSKPIVDFLQGQLEISEEGCLQVDRQNQTNIPGVYAIGDVICTHVKQAVIAAGDGAIAAIAAEKFLRGKSKAKVDWAK